MGNTNSKSAEGTPASPVASHPLGSSTAHSRKAKPLPTHYHQNASLSPTEKTPHPEKQPHQAATSSPSHRRPQEDPIGNETSKQRHHDDRKKEKSRVASKATPVKVPRGSDPRRQRGPDSQFEPSGPPRDPNYIPHSNLNFPPRLPLPIEEEVHTPGSPILTAQGVSSSLHEDDVDGTLPRQSSVVSSTTIEDDELGDELQPYPYEVPRGTVPTTLQWKQGGERVYVTGTFAGWSRKFRMNRDSVTRVYLNNNLTDLTPPRSPATGHLSAVLQLPPGTHHVKFIIDGEMQLSNELPTAVDYTNILVNYVEISADDIPNEPKEELKVPEGLHPPQTLHQDTEVRDHAPNSVSKPQLVEGESKAEPVFWGKEVPKYLHDVDLPEQSRRYARAARGLADFATPPGLPLFLNKSILNGTTPMKDDSSVLNMPNHTVLNHLATSSIKNQVLATSITTRYKRKYVTTIVYKPTEDSD